MSGASPKKQSGVSFALWETVPDLSLVAPGPPDRGHYGRRVRLDRSGNPERYGQRQGASDWSTLAERARHPPYRRGASGVRPNQMVLSARSGRRAESVLSDHLVATRLAKGARKLAPQRRSCG